MILTIAVGVVYAVAETSGVFIELYNSSRRK